MCVHNYGGQVQYRPCSRMGQVKERYKLGLHSIIARRYNRIEVNDIIARRLSLIYSGSLRALLFAWIPLPLKALQKSPYVEGGVTWQMNILLQKAAKRQH